MSEIKPSAVAGPSPDLPGVARVREMLPRGSSIQTIADDGEVLLKLPDGQSRSLRVPLETVPSLRKAMGPAPPGRSECG